MKLSAIKHNLYSPIIDFTGPRLWIFRILVGLWIISSLLVGDGPFGRVGYAPQSFLGFGLLALSFRREDLVETGCACILLGSLAGFVDVFRISDSYRFRHLIMWPLLHGRIGDLFRRLFFDHWYILGYWGLIGFVFFGCLAGWLILRLLSKRYLAWIPLCGCALSAGMACCFNVCAELRWEYKIYDVVSSIFAVVFFCGFARLEFVNRMKNPENTGTTSTLLVRRFPEWNARLMQVLLVGLYVVCALMLFSMSTLRISPRYGDEWWQVVWSLIVMFCLARILSRCLSWRKRIRRFTQHSERSLTLQIIGYSFILSGILAMLWSFISFSIDVNDIPTFGFSYYVKGWMIHAFGFFMFMLMSWAFVSIGMIFLSFADILSFGFVDSKRDNVLKRLEFLRGRLSSLRNLGVEIRPEDALKIGEESLGSISKSLTDHINYESELNRCLGEIEARYDELETECLVRMEQERCAEVARKAEVLRVETARVEAEEAERRAETERIEAARRAEAERIEAERRALPARPAVQELLGQMIDIPGGHFKMCKYECTQALWKAIMGNNPSKFKGSDRPVECVSWYACQKFLNKLNANPDVKQAGLVFRFPTEKEWEYACQAGSEGRYCKLSDCAEITKETLDKVAWYKENSNGETHPVGQKQPNAFGLYDMHGNVLEWTSTSDGFGRIGHGGCWFNGASGCTCSVRFKLYPFNRSNGLGFRLAVSSER